MNKWAALGRPFFCFGYDVALTVMTVYCSMLGSEHVQDVV